MALVEFQQNLLLLNKLLPENAMYKQLQHNGPMSIAQLQTKLNVPAVMEDILQ